MKVENVSSVKESVVLGETSREVPLEKYRVCYLPRFPQAQFSRYLPLRCLTYCSITKVVVLDYIFYIHMHQYFILVFLLLKCQILFYTNDKTSKPFI